MNGWEAVVESLNAEKVRFVFGLPGDPRNLYDALYDATEIKPILVRHETSAVFMAMAYARLTGEPGICHGTLGPGVANLVPGILEAYSACMPVIAVCPAVSSQAEGMGALQECDQVPIFKPITKWSARVPRPERVPWFMHRAFSLAVNGKPGPIFIEVPGDVGHEEVVMPRYIPAGRPIRVRGDSERIKAAANLLLRAERPVIVAGGGVILSRAFQELRELSEMLGIPILTSVSGRGCISEDHPLALGLVGLFRTKVGKKYYEDSDLLLSVGCRNEELQSGSWKFFPKGARFIQIDIDPFEIGRNWIPDVAVVGDAKCVLKDLIECMREKIRVQKLEDMPRVKEIVKAKKDYEVEVESECMTDAVPIKTKRIVRELNKVFGENTILVNENGSQDVWSYYFPYYKVLNMGDCIPPAEQTCMGFGVAGAIGAKLTRPDKKVVCVTGDGAFQMFMKELPTAVQYKAPVTWIITNNFSLGWPKFIQMASQRYIAVDFEVQPDFVKIAESNRCYGERIDQPAEIKPALENALRANNEGTPAVLDFIIDPSDYNEYFKEFHRNIWGVRVP